jgi:hypothetical protein
MDAVRQALAFLNNNVAKPIASFINSDAASQMAMAKGDAAAQQAVENRQKQQAMNTNNVQQPQTNTNPVQQATPTSQPSFPIQSSVVTQQSPASTPTPVQGAIQTLTPTPYPPSQMPKGATSFEGAAAPLFEQAKIPAAIGMGIWAEEGRGKTINPNNPYNIGAIDSNPQNANAYGFKTPIDGAAAAVKFLQGESPYQSANVKQIFQKAYQQLQKNNDPEAYLKAIGKTYSSNKNWATQIMQTPEYARWAGGN